MIKFKFINFTFINIVTVLSFIAVAQDEGLYPDPPPANAAFVRVVHSTPNFGTINPLVGDKAFPELVFGEVSNYYIVIQGDRKVTFGELEQSIEIFAGKFYTLALTSGEENPLITLIEDGNSTNRAKALLSLYNLSTLEKVDLKTVDGAVDVLTDVLPLETASIEVNAIKVDLGIFAEKELIKDFKGLALERGAVYSAIVMDNAEDEAPQAVWVLTKTILEE